MILAGLVWHASDWIVFCSSTESWRSLLTVLLPEIGFWKGAVVAVKVIVHNASMARKVDTLRESLVGISMQHPHVVRLPPGCCPAQPALGFSGCACGLPASPSHCALELW